MLCVKHKYQHSNASSSLRHQQQARFTAVSRAAALRCSSIGLTSTLCLCTRVHTSTLPVHILGKWSPLAAVFARKLHRIAVAPQRFLIGPQQAVKACLFVDLVPMVIMKHLQGIRRQRCWILTSLHWTESHTVGTTSRRRRSQRPKKLQLLYSCSWVQLV